MSETDGSFERVVCNCDPMRMTLADVTDGWAIRDNGRRTGMQIEVRCPTHPKSSKLVVLPRRN